MGISHIKNQFETDEQNRKAVYVSVGAAADLPDTLVAVYESHYASIAKHLPDYSGQIAGALYVACRKHLVLGMTSLFRRYATQAFRETRAAVEAAGVANVIRRDAESFRIFREDRDEPSRKSARKHFRPAILFTGELAVLQGHYDKASALSHTNRRTLAPHLDVVEGTFRYRDLRDCDIPSLATNYLIWICGAHLSILEVADFIFLESNAELNTKFKTDRRRFGERLCRFADANEGKAYRPAES